MTASILDTVKIKQNDHGELIVILFELCNLSCQMCYQDHNSKIGMDTIKEKFDLVASSMLALKNQGKKSTTVNFMGGELFADNIPDELFSDYEDLILRVKDYGKSIDLITEMHIATNLIWTKTERVKSLLDKINVPISVSYDPTGRFNTDTFEIFKKNVIEFKQYIKSVGTVMTRPSMTRFIQDNVPFFDYLYNNFETVFDHYGPDGGEYFPDPNEKASLVLMPTDVNLRDFYKFMVDRWPNSQPFKELVSKNPQSLSCMGTLTVKQDSRVESCTKYDVQSTPKQHVVTFFGNLSKHKDKWVEDYNCLACKHMQYCSFGCFMNNHKSKIRTQEECWLKEVYDYVNKKN